MEDDEFAGSADAFNESVLTRQHGGRIPRSVYRFLSDQHFKRIWDLVVANELFLCGARSFNDPFDCQIDLEIDFESSAFRPFAQQMIDHVGAKRSPDEFFPNATVSEAKIRSAVDSIRDRYGISCFSADIDVPLLWAHYANGHRGVAVEFDVLQLGRSNLMPAPVDYQPEVFKLRIPDEGFENVIFALHTKGLIWSYEKEFRIIRVGQANTSHPFPLDALRAIHFGMCANQGFVRDVATLLTKHRSLHARNNVELRLAERNGLHKGLSFRAVPAAELGR